MNRKPNGLIVVLASVAGLMGGVVSRSVSGGATGVCGED